MADELRAEQDHCASQGKAKRALEAQVKIFKGQIFSYVKIELGYKKFQVKKYRTR